MDVLIRKVLQEDIVRLAEIEEVCFPEEEAASLKTIQERYSAFSENFLAAEAGGKIVGFINGCATNSAFLYDALYHDAREHVPDGKYLTVFGLDVLPDYQRKGIAAMLMEQYIQKSMSERRKGIILTCKDHLVHYYEKFGFTSGGVSESSHGGAVWYDMLLDLELKK